MDFWKNQLSDDDHVKPAPDPALKGKKGGNCNRTCCQKPGAFWFNHSTRAFYCQPCAVLLNDNNPSAVELYGHALCTVDPEAKEMVLRQR